MPIPVKLTRAHQVTLPKRLLERAGWTRQEFFVADLEGGALVLKPLMVEPRTRIADFDALRRHFTRLGITSRDVQDAVAWARARSASERRHTKPSR
ncbi:MAG: hypothetical protein A3C53_07160 [Omnitrophica WOR_2 bacterium RIFCSPHIGHO2_02_FULL_68_15]|nr:MAG: hypothetical protein A3C53_07160 [Omnitrophica WOR_2 bacterium RIFCSPHIGHO2_02_FULL_68_15]